MSDAIREISKACQALEVKESAPPIAGIDHILSLLFGYFLINSDCLFFSHSNVSPDTSDRDH